MRATATGPERARASGLWSYAYLGFGAVMGLTLVLLRGSELATLPLTMVGLGTCGAVFTGRRRFRPATTFSWTLFGLSCIVFVLGAAARQVFDGTAAAPLADLFTLSGYAGTLVAFVALLRNRQSRGSGVHELVDGVIVCVSAGSAAVVFLSLPIVQSQGWSAYTVLLGAYPVIDVVIVFVTLLMSWTSANRVVSFWLLGVTMTAMMIGDVGYAYIGTHGQIVGSHLLDLPYIVAFACFGAAALHPSMAALSAIQPRAPQAWSRSRLSVLVPALLVPSIVVIVSQDSGTDWVCGIAASAVVLLLLVRALGAVHQHTASQQGLRYQASHDALTGLANRSRLLERVDSLIRRAEVEGGHVDLVFLDLDSFKLVNDTWGHPVGDTVLRSAAERLRLLADPTDVVARVGGDEFVIGRYVGATSSHTGESLAADIIDSFRSPLSESDTALVVTVSLGLVRSEHPATAEGLLRDADTAMYRAKGAGRNRCVTFDSTMHDDVRRRVETELALRHALELQQLMLFYQPIVDLETARVVGVEALLRWAHPGMGMVSPLDFIPVAEETGLIVEIGEWVVTEALRQLAVWRADGHDDLWVSVNVSARQLRDASLVEHVERELRRLGVPAERLMMEITETAMMSDERTSADLLHRLRALGVTLAVDDFGTGYSSLGHLRRFPVSKVKIDRAFVSGLETDNDDAEIVRAVVAMSLAMRLDTVAEGIETEGQRALLLHAGVQLGQGWLFGRPVPAEECRFESIDAVPVGQALRAKSYPM